MVEWLEEMQQEEIAEQRKRLVGEVRKYCYIKSKNHKLVWDNFYQRIEKLIGKLPDEKKLDYIQSTNQLGTALRELNRCIRFNLI